MQIADIGTRFGNSVSNIFDPWNPRIIHPYSIEELKNHLEQTDLICFGGGEDISPSMYGHRNVSSGSAYNPSFRDLFEREVWKIAQTSKIPVLGICRGAQLTCVLSGGSLIQDVRGHCKTNSHTIKTLDGLKIDMSSYHHQMMYCKNVDHLLLGWLDSKEFSVYTYDESKIKLLKPFLEPEVVFFPQTKALGVQGHPEYSNDPFNESQEFTRNMVQHYLGVKP